MTWKKDLLEIGIFITAVLVYFFELCILVILSIVMPSFGNTLPIWLQIVFGIELAIPPIIIYKALNKILTEKKYNKSDGITCSNLALHSFKNIKNPNCKCGWCGITLREARDILVESIESKKKLVK